MSVAVLSAVPSQIVAGDAVLFVLSTSGYPSSLWAGKFTLARDGSALKNVDATASGTGFLVTLESSDTAGLDPGSAQWSFAVVEIATSRRVTAPDGLSGSIRIAPNPQGTLSPTSRLAVLKAALANAELQVTRQSQFQMNGFGNNQTVNHQPHRLREEVDRCKMDIDAELVRCGQPRIYDRGMRSISVL